MRRITRLTAVGAIALTALLWGSDSYAAPLPAVATVIEGRDSDTGDAVLVLVGTRVNKFKTFALLDAIGADAGTLTRVLKSRSLLVLTLPPDTEAGDYELVMTYGRGGSSSLTVPISVTRFETEEGSVHASALSEPLLTDLADADFLEGAPRVYFEDAASILSGVLDTERYSAYDDLVSELKIGSAVDQLAAGDHDHDDRYFTQAAITDPGVLNDAANPLEWTKLKNVPDGLLDGTAHDHDALYFKKDELMAAGALNDAGNPVDWTKLKSVPVGFADGIDADTTYTAGDGLALTGVAFETLFAGNGTALTSSHSDHDHDAVYAKSANLASPGSINASGNPVDWTKLKSVPGGFADGNDANTTYSAGTNLSLAGTVFSVPTFPWTDLTAVPAGFSDGVDDDTTYSAGTNMSLAGTVFSVPAFPWSDLLGVPSGLDDGDDDTTYSAGTGLSLIGTQFAVNGVPWTALSGIPSGFADGVDNDTRYSAGTGLTLSGTTLSTLFGGTGTAANSSRSDHLHDTRYYQQSQLNTSGTINVATNPIDWTRLKNVPAGIADGTDDGALWTESGVNVYRSGGSVGIGTTSPTAPLHVNGNGVLFEGSSGSGAFPASGGGRRVMWHPGTASLRAGQVTGTQWDAGSVGPYSVAFGFNTKASQQYAAAFGNATLASGSGSFAAGLGAEATASSASVAFGERSRATANWATAMGYQTTASGLYSMSTGYQTTASGKQAFAANDRTKATGWAATSLGWNSEAQAFASLVIGKWNVVEGSENGWLPTDPVFVVGNGTSTSIRSNALTLLKNGNLTIAGGLHVNGGVTVSGSLDLNDADGLALEGTLGVGTIAATGAGTRFLWYPRKAAVRGGRVAGAAWDDANIGSHSTAFGLDTVASGDFATALGVTTNTGSYGSLAIGRYNALHASSKTTWRDTDPLLVCGNGSGALSRSNALTLLKNGDLDIAGSLRTQGDDGALFEGDGPMGSVAAGPGSIPASGAGTRFMWYPAKAALRAGQVDGTQWDDTNVGTWSIAFGSNTRAGGYNSAAMGYDTTASGPNSTAMGASTTASGLDSTAMGLSTTASGDVSTAMGGNTTASGDVCTAMGGNTTASGEGSTAMGLSTTASGDYSTAMGDSTTASGDYSTAMGASTTASGWRATAMGGLTTASGGISTAMGSSTTASGDYSTAIGTWTTADSYASVALGRFNTVNTGRDADSWDSIDPVLQVGNGGSSTTRSDALILYKDGDMTIAGTLAENSDVRLKKDIAPLVGVLPKLANVRGVTYRFKDTSTAPAGEHVGLIAQEVRDAFPELVSENSQGTLSVAYGKFTAVLLEAVKEQQETIQTQRGEIDELKSRLARIEALLERMSNSKED